MLNRRSSLLGILTAFSLLWVEVVAAQSDIIVYEKFGELGNRIRRTDENTVLILNFWATWCKPCVAELPSFDSLAQKYEGTNVRVLLVSLDSKTKVDKVQSLLLEKELTLETVILADQDADSWIQQVEKEWDGAIPFSIVYKGKRRSIHKGDFKNYTELEAWIKPFLEPIKPSDATKR
jgi:thiol-disulfide isomerase/thioredoxin